MKSILFTAGFLAAAANAHYTFPHLVYNGETSAAWEYVRQTENYQSHGPLTDTSSSKMGCYQLASGSQGASTLTVSAGDEVGFALDPQVQHPGPLSFWLAKAPDTVEDWDPTGDVWFKIWEDDPTITSSTVTWDTNPLNDNKGVSTVSVTLPTCIAPGEYLLRVQHIGLHSAEQVGGAQFYIGCAQLNIESSGSLDPSSKVSLPGAIAGNDPGVAINIWWPVPTEYINPGPAPITC